MIEPKESHEQKHHAIQSRIANFLMASTIIACVITCTLLLRDGEPSATNANGAPFVAAKPLLTTEQATVDLFRAASPSVVHIKTPAFRVRRGFSVMRVPEGTGTGFLWDDGQHVVTNYHVIRNTDKAEVIFADGSSISAKVVGYEATRDLAVLRLAERKSGMRQLALGTSDDLQVGQNVYAIGNPFGLDQTLTTGVVSALGREIESPPLDREGKTNTIWDVIQTDAAINPGNSGGPLLDSSGRVIGINTAIYSPNGGSAGIGFAIPIDSVRRVVPDLIEHGKFMRPVLGFYPATEDIRKRFGLRGVLVLRVAQQSPAERAGFAPTVVTERGDVILGDMVVAVEDQPVVSKTDFDRVMDDFEIGDTVAVTLERDGKRRQVPVVLEGSGG